MSTDISLPDYIELRNLAYDWVESYDTKDWELLRRCLAPSITLDFRQFGGVLHENITPDEYIALHQAALGEKKLQTQHFVGASKYEKQSDGTVQAWHQLRAAHQRYADDDLTNVVNKGHAHGNHRHTYRKVDGKWKIERGTPGLYWSEYDLLSTVWPKDKGS